MAVTTICLIIDVFMVVLAITLGVASKKTYDRGNYKLYTKLDNAYDAAIILAFVAFIVTLVAPFFAPADQDGSRAKSKSDQEQTAIYTTQAEREPENGITRGRITVIHSVGKGLTFACITDRVLGNVCAPAELKMGDTVYFTYGRYLKWLEKTLDATDRNAAEEKLFITEEEANALLATGEFYIRGEK